MRQSEGFSYLYVVLLVTRTHHAVVYEMPTAAAPENAIAKSKKFRVSSGLPNIKRVSASDATPTIAYATYKLRTRFAALQSSAISEKIARTGIDRRLL